jgi:hypothetical protein
MLPAIRPSGAAVKVFWNPLVVIPRTYGHSKRERDALQLAIIEHLRHEQRMLEIVIHDDWRMFVGWGIRGLDFISVEVRLTEHNCVAILGEIDQALSRLT